MSYIPGHTNQQLFVAELCARGIDVTSIDPEQESIICRYKDHVEYVFDRHSSLHTFPTLTMMADKFLTKEVLRQANIVTPLGIVCDTDQLSQAKTYIESIGYPVVIKPVRGSHGENVHLHLTAWEACQNALTYIQAKQNQVTPCIIEQYIPGHEYRVFITETGKFACLELVAPYMIGDGTLTIQEYIDKENKKRDTRNTVALYPIFPDVSYISQQGYTLESIPTAGVKVYLRHTTNVATGGITIDMTDKVHPGFHDICMRAIKAFPNSAYAGIDIITEDITLDPHLYPYAIIEINSNPSFSIHMRPSQGTPRNVAALVADLLFPETSDM